MDCLSLCVQNWKVHSLFFAYLITITSHVHDLFWEAGSIRLAMMLQANHCLLYLSVSFSHLKRSTDSVILMGREPCPFLFGLIWRVPAKWTILAPAIHLLSVVLYGRPCSRVRARARVFVRMDKRVCTKSVCAGFWYSSCTETLFKEIGQNSVLSSSRFGSPLKV